jgi:hypothetical protein
MPNRLEQEFPSTTWPVMLPHDMDSMQYYLERGRRLHALTLNQTIGQFSRAISTALGRAIAIIAALGRDVVHGRVDQSHETHCKTADARCA